MPLFKRKPVVGKPTLNTQKPEGTGKFTEVKRAYEGCLAHGGVPIMAFGQGQKFIRDVWKTQYVGTGICQALVNYWMADHASGSSLWSRLYDRNGVFNSHGILEIAVQQGEFGKKDSLGTDTKKLQKLRSQAYLEGKGLSLISTYKGGERRVTSIGIDVDRSWRIGSAIAYGGMKNAIGGHYRMISLTSDTVSHVTCAWVQKDVSFFDPNYGEYYFADRERFVEWFAKFWVTDTYDNFDGFVIYDYALTV